VLTKFQGSDLQNHKSWLVGPTVTNDCEEYDSIIDDNFSTVDNFLNPGRILYARPAFKKSDNLSIFSMRVMKV
jgi:hypothetical protein